MKGTGHTVEELIRLEAYLLSEQAGHPTHMEKSFWVQAEAIVHGRIAAMAPSSTTKNAKSSAAAKAPVKTPVKKVAAPAAEAEKQLLLTPEALATAKPMAKKAATPSATKAKAATKTTSAAKALSKSAPKAK